VESIDLAVDVRPEVVRYRLDDVRYDRGALEPGEPLEVECVLERYRGAQEVRRLRIQLPEDLPEAGRLRLAVGSPDALDRMLGSPLERRLDSATDAATVVRALVDRRSPHRLTAIVYEAEGALVARGEEWVELPPTAQRLLTTQSTPTRRGVAPPRALARAEIELPGPIEGGAQVALRTARLPSGLRDEASR
jgi:hypothetical protein